MSSSLLSLSSLSVESAKFKPMDELGTVGGSFGSMELGSFELGFVELGFMEWVFALFLWSFDFLLLLVLHYSFG